MRIDVTTIVSLKDDQGQEITRTVAKAHTSSFELTDDVAQIDRRLNHALSGVKNLATHAIQAVLATLRA